MFFADTIQDAIREKRPYRPPVSIHFPGDAPGTELVHKVTNVRRVNFFPEHSAQKHAQLERQLADFVNTKRKRFGWHIGMMTFNGGGRWRDGASTDRLRQGRGEMRRAMTKLFRQKLFRQWFEPINIGEEYGTPKGRYSRRRNSWRWHMHTHAHTLQRVLMHCPDFNRLMTWVRLRYYECLTGVKFPRLCRLMKFSKDLTPAFQARVDGWLKESQAVPLVEYDGAIMDVQEACKYPFKDKDLRALYNDGGAQPIRDLYDNLFRARLCTPLNSFRKWRKEELTEVDGFKRKIIAEKSPGGDYFYRHVKDWNCQTPNAAEAISERKKRAKSLAEVKRSKSAKTLALRAILKSRLAEWGDFRKTPNYRVESFPRNDFRIEGFDYKAFSSDFCLKREIAHLFGRLIASSVLFDTPIPAFVLEDLRRFPNHVQGESSAIFEIASTENIERRPVRNFVTARLAPSFLGGGTIARPGIVVIGASQDGRVWQTNPLARRLERLARPLIAAAVEQRDAEAAFPDFAPAYDASAGAGLVGRSQTPLNFHFLEFSGADGPPENDVLAALDAA
ncbi:hypothetical protein [Termitidicoccus mucosus]|uniref:hypothetical protein n=1 Tax=Termitidicoccus mucosus TaxID=1184151 RepID=UPI002FEE5C75